MLGFAPLSTYPFSAFPSIFVSSGVFGTGAIGVVTATSGRSITVTGVRGTGVTGVLGGGKGSSITVSGVRGTGVVDHACFRKWNEVDTIVC